MHRIGFMQGRLSPQVDGKIQAFPTQHWRNEFVSAEVNGFGLMEWTLDHEALRENPLLTRAGRAEIAALSERHGVQVQSLTGDCFMQAPFFKADGAQAAVLKDELFAVVEACAEARIKFVLIPLVDNGSIENEFQADRLRDGLRKLEPMLGDAAMKIVFESDYPPVELGLFMDTFAPQYFAVNYDIGNSAGLGFDPGAEIGAYVGRIENVHVKDRVLGGTTVPLGTGAADLPRTIALLKAGGYRGDFILQTARAADGRHAEVLCGYRDIVRRLLTV